MLEISGVKQSFRTGFWMKETEILKGISFSVSPKSIFGFIGPNGAGKTTLIHLITGIKKPKSGSLKLNGFACDSRESRAKLGYLPERPYFYEHLSGRSLLLYFGRLSGLSDSVILDRIPDILSKVGMSKAADVELKNYSKGMLQRIGIAQAIIHDPEFLVLDEPMSGLDPMGRKEMRELVLSLASEGKTIFFTSHVISDVEAICDEVAVIKKGEIVTAGSTANLLSGRPTQYEFGFSGVTLEQVRALSLFESFREMPEGVRAILPGAQEVNEVLEKLLGLKSKILWVSPVRPSLEDLFK